MDYSKTINLLSTNFPMKADLPTREPLLLDAWEKNHLYEKTINHRKGKPVFLLHDGPPYANGDIHMGHALNKTLKDFVVKYKALAGFQAPYKPGWDTHGLPIEHALFKQMGKNKHQVSQLELREKAKEYALGFVDKQRQDFKRLGILGDWEHPYLTLANDYESGIVDVFFQLQKKGFIYRKKKPGYWCAFDETALAEAEVEYADKKSDSVFVRFKLKPETIPAAVKDQLKSPENSYALIWTTTPWTLPANVGLAFHPDEKYVALSVKGFEVIVAEKLKDAVAQKLKVAVEASPIALTGSSYAGMEATNPLHGRTSRAVTADYVTMEDGTGIVHIAPGHGAEDYQVGLQWELEVLSPVDERGMYTTDVGREDLVGKHVLKDANAAVIADLGDNLLFMQTIKHSYPHCWRCKNPIIFRATEQWFLRIDDSMRERLLKEIDSVRWEPSYGIHRIKGMVETRPDWCLSRQRHWGAPIAVFYCANCHEILQNDQVNKRLVEWIRKDGTDVWYKKSEAELLDGLNISCAKCGSTSFKKETDILDVWFDSGVSWHSVIDEYFSNPKPQTVMYLEGSDQHRGWFQTSLIPSVAVTGEAPFDIVLTHGFVMDGKGHKMSKSLGNVIAPQEIIQKYGADILRLWVAMSDYRDDVRLSQDILNHVIDMYRRFRNTFRFLLQNTSDFNLKKDQRSLEQLEEIDRWILVHFEDVKAKVLKAYEAYEFHGVLNELNRFAAVTLSGFYLDALKDRLYCEAPDSPRRRSAQTAFVHLTRGLCVLLAPLLSFTSEEAFLELRRSSWPELPESVFLDEIAGLMTAAADSGLNEKWSRILELRSQVNDVLDRQRKAGVVKSSQEAELHLNPSKLAPEHQELLDTNEDWPFIFQMSKVVINGRDQETSIEIASTKSGKCERCWRHRDEVGSSTDHPTLCARCLQVVTSQPA